MNKKKKSVKIQITNSVNEGRINTTDVYHSTLKINKEYHEQCQVPKFDNLGEMNKFLERCEQVKFT